MSGQIVISPQDPAVISGKTITLTSNTPVTWSLNGVGSLSNVTSTSATYTAPAGVVAKNQMLGCPVGPNDSIFNTRIDNLPVHSRSSAWIGASTTNPTAFEDDNWGISIADNSTPTRTLHTFYSDVVVPNFVMPPAGPNLKRQGGDYVGIWGVPNTPDHHIMTVKHTDCTFYETYDDYLGVTRACNDGTSGCNVQSATVYSSTSYKMGSPDSGTNAGGIPLAPTIWSLADIQSGNISHATTFTTNTASVAFPGYVWPAGENAGGCDPATCPNAMPLGTRLRLKGSFNSAAVCKSGVAAKDAACNTIITGLKQYGMILSDTGLANSVQFLSEVTEDPVVTAALQQLVTARIPFTNFEAVDESSLEVDPTSYQVCPLGQACKHGINSYVAPSSQAIVTATDLSGKSLSTPVAIQAVSIGLGIPGTLAIATGNYSYQIPAWVNGSADQTIQWTLVSGVGSLSSSGLYTPPPSTSGIGVTDTAVLRGVSKADPAASITVHLSVIQSASNGAVRIDTGSLVPTKDANGNVWSADIGIEGAATAITSDYPHWNRTNPAATIAYETLQDGDDLGNTIIVPNGTYNLHMLFGMPDMGLCTVCTTWLANRSWNKFTFAPLILEAQGIVEDSSFDFGEIGNYRYQAPVDTYIPATVTNNLLQVYVRSQISDVPPFDSPVSSKRTLLNGLEIIPTGSAPVIAPSWSINTFGQATIEYGQTLRPFALVTAGGAPNNPTWRIISGPTGAKLNGSTLSLTGRLATKSQPIVIQATDGKYSATATITTVIPLPPKGVLSANGYSRQMTISRTSVAAEVTNFPVLVSINDPLLASTTMGGHVTAGNENNFYFAQDSAGAHLLSWEVESYNASNGTLVAHVLLPKVSHTADTVFYLLYGNLKLDSRKSAPSSVWSSGYTAVYHFGLPANLTIDSSRHGGSLLTDDLSWRLGEIAGSGLVLKNGAELPPTVFNKSSGTFEAWVSFSATTGKKASWSLFGQVGDTDADHFKLWWNNHINGLEADWSNQSESSGLQSGGVRATLSHHRWNHVVYTWDANSGAQNLYLNGTLLGSVWRPMPSFSSSRVVTLGSDLTDCNGVDQILDEVRFSNVVRSSDWIAAEFANQSNPSKFVTIGEEVGQSNQ